MGHLQCGGTVRRPSWVAAAGQQQQGGCHSGAGGSGNGNGLARLLYDVTGGGVGRVLHLTASACAGVGAKINAARGEVLRAGCQIVDHGAGFAAQFAHAGGGFVQRFIGYVACRLHGVLGTLQNVVCEIAGAAGNFVGGGLDIHGVSPKVWEGVLAMAVEEGDEALAISPFSSGPARRSRWP
jgi:hypothetical protein